MCSHNTQMYYILCCRNPRTSLVYMDVLLQSDLVVWGFIVPRYFYFSVSGIFTSVLSSFIYEQPNLFAIFRNWRREGQINGEWTSVSRKVSARHLDMMHFCNSILIMWLFVKLVMGHFSACWTAISIRTKIGCTFPPSGLVYILHLHIQNVRMMVES